MLHKEIIINDDELWKFIPIYLDFFEQCDHLWSQRAAAMINHFVENTNQLEGFTFNVVGKKYLLEGILSQLVGITFRLIGNTFWVVGTIFRVVGMIFRVVGNAFYVVGIRFRVVGIVFKVVGIRFRVVGSVF